MVNCPESRTTQKFSTIVEGNLKKSGRNGNIRDTNLMRCKYNWDATTVTPMRLLTRAGWKT